MGFISKIAIKKDSEVVLKRFSQTLISKAEGCTNQVKKEYNFSETLDVRIQFQALFVRFVDVLAYSLLGPTKRNQIVAQLKNEIADHNMKSYFQNPSAADKENILNNLSKLSNYYSKCQKFFPAQDESPEDTFFWEFGKKLASVLGREDDMDCITFCLKLAAEAIPTLKVQQTLESLR